jgi:mRNA interferase YafQ
VASKRLEVAFTSAFRRDIKRETRRGSDLSKLLSVLIALSLGEQLAPARQDHALTGNYAGYRECHIAPDWLLVYRTDADGDLLVAARTGSHSDLF